MEESAETADRDVMQMELDGRSAPEKVLSIWAGHGKGRADLVVEVSCAGETLRGEVPVYRTEPV